MNTTRVLSKPTYSVTLLIVSIGTFVCIVAMIPLLMNLNEQGKLLEGIGMFFTALGLISSIGIWIYDKQQAALDKINNQRDAMGIKYVENIIILSLNSQEATINSDRNLEGKAHLNASGMKREDIKAMIPPELEDRSDILLAEVSQITEQIDMRRNVANHLEQNSEHLRNLTVSATNEVLDKLSESRLKKRGLLEKKSRGYLYSDVYRYLKGWLKISIEYDIPMPEDRITKSSLDRMLYVKILENIRDHRITEFGLEDELSRNMVRRYLNILLDRLENT